MCKTFAYLRVSTDRQELDNQRLEISRYAESKGLAVDEWIEAEISSRKDMKRRGITDLLSRLRKGDVLIVSELSRLARSIHEASEIFHELTKQRVHLHVIKQNIVTAGNGEADIQTKVLVWAFALCAELERDLISQRTKSGLARAKAQGKKLGNPSVERLNAGRTKAANSFAESVREVFTTFRQAGLTQRDMVGKLNRMGIKSARGGEWSLSTVQQALKRLGL